MDIAAASDRSLLVRLPDHERTIAFAAAVAAAEIPGVTGYSPAHTSVLVRYDPVVLDGEALQQRLVALGETAIRRVLEPRRVVLPVTFDGADLEDLATNRGFSVSAVVEIFCSTDYRVYFLGFLPGFAYMGDVDDRIAAPRRRTPRRSVPAGSVGIAARQTGIYPVETPGGWNLIGRCDIPMFSPERNPPALLMPGDHVSFRPA